MINAEKHIVLHKPYFFLQKVQISCVRMERGNMSEGRSPQHKDTKKEIHEARLYMAHRSQTKKSDFLCTFAIGETKRQQGGKE